MISSVLSVLFGIACLVYGATHSSPWYIFAVGGLALVVGLGSSIASALHRG